MAVHASGKRKTAKARATVRDGDGRLRINSRPLTTRDEMFRQRVREPLVLAGKDTVEEVDIDVNVSGGGKQGQAEATRMAIARALVEHTDDDDLEKRYMEYDRMMLVEDPRRTETRKPSQSSKGARHKQQKSYR